MIDVKNKVCATHFCEVYIEKKYTYCLRCAIFMGDTSDWVTQFKWKEHIIWDYLITKFSHLTLIFNKAVEGGCSKKRPDVLIEFGNKCIIIEVDEEQHKNYVCE